MFNWNRLLNALNQAKDLTGRAAQILAVRVLGALLQFCFFLILAKEAGVDGFGLFSLGYSIMLIASAVSRWGMDQIAIRELAVHASKSDWPRYQATYKNGLKMVLVGGLVISGLLWIVLQITSAFMAGLAKNIPVLGWLILAVIPFSITQYVGECMRTKGMQISASMLQTVAAPALILVALLLPWPEHKSIEGIAIAYVIACSVVGMISLKLWRDNTPETGLSNGLQGSVSPRRMFEVATPLAMATIMTTWLGFSEIVMLGFMRGAEDVAGYAASVRVLFLFGFVVITLNNVLSPTFALMYKNNDLPTLWRLVKRASMAGVLIAFPMLLAMFLFSGEIIGLFGKEFLFAVPALQILTVGQFFLCFAGTWGTVLIMSGHERIYRRIIAFSVLVNLLAGPILIHAYGIVGAAISASITIVVANIMCLIAITKLCRVRIAR
ncbi:MAG TPA: hypothetical protein DFK12_13870 [Gallionellaceae bacterium]|nr:hypothetical protein [Gallionellaceae bacterium]